MVLQLPLGAEEKHRGVIDLASRRVLFNELVAHGANSGETYASEFSNRVGSRQTSIGLFRTDETYYGRHGLSLRLSGLEPGFNDRARERAIVMHGASYVSDAVVSTYGSLGRSWGCPRPARRGQPAGHRPHPGGSAVFAYYPDNGWLHGSRFINCDARVAAR